MLTAAEKILRKALVSSKKLETPEHLTDKNGKPVLDGEGAKIPDRGLDSRGWLNHVQAGLRDRAFFSSQVSQMHILDAARRVSAEYAGGGSDLSRLRMQMREYLQRGGYAPQRGEEGTVKDLLSKSRLDAIIKTNVDQARGFINYASGIEPGAFAAFPAQKLQRIQRRTHPRQDWPERWRQAMDKVGGKECTVAPDGRMVALKTSPVWAALSVFGLPYPPFDWGSGMGVVDVSKDEAIKLGLVTAEKLKREVEKLEKRREEGTLPSLTGNLSAKVTLKAKDFQQLKDTFGDFVKLEDNEVSWREDWTESFLRDAGKKGFSFNAGLPTKSLLDVVARDIDKDHADMIREDRQLVINDEWLNDEGSHDRQPGHGRKHLYGNETSEGNIGMTSHDLELLPSLWRTPTRADYSEREDNVLLLEIDTFDGCVIQARIAVSKHGQRLKTIFKRRTSEIEENRGKRAAERAAIRARQKKKKEG